MKLIKSKNYQEMCAKVARIFAAQITLKPESVLGLATGSTPIGMYGHRQQVSPEGCVQHED